MAILNDLYRCELCGNIVEVVRAGGGEPACCGQPMKRLAENTVDASKEKHLPVIERQPNGVKVTVGSIPHPMEAKHFIEWIELFVDGQVLRQTLKPGDAPSAFFPGVAGATLAAREFCNLHGVWKA